MKKVNLFVLTTTLANKIGIVLNVKVRNNGNLLLRCGDEEQLEKVVKLKEIGKLQVEWWKAHCGWKHKMVVDVKE